MNPADPDLRTGSSRENPNTAKCQFATFVDLVWTPKLWAIGPPCHEGGGCPRAHFQTWKRIQLQVPVWRLDLPCTGSSDDVCLSFTLGLAPDRSGPPGLILMLQEFCFHCHNGSFCPVSPLWSLTPCLPSSNATRTHSPAKVPSMIAFFQEQH